MKTHEEAIAALGFVHERLPAGHEKIGVWFTPRADFDAGRGGNAPPVIRVALGPRPQGTKLIFGLDRPDVGTSRFVVIFSANTPGHLVNQAVAAAMKEA